MRLVITLLFLFICNGALAQPDSLFFKEETPKPLQPAWTKENKATLDISEVAFVNWNAGGSNSISALLGVNISRNFKSPNLVWKNNALVRYGINKQEEQKIRKTDDRLEFNSDLGFKKDSLRHWYFSTKFNFKTQFTSGYNYPDRSNPISRFMAPGYLFLGAGAEYGKEIEKLLMYFSPLTLKATFVNDADLANAGAFGVTPAVVDEEGNIIEPGSRSRTELGILFTNAYETDLTTNVKLVNALSLYTDYVNRFGNIDVDWAVNFDFKVNEFIRATLGSHLKYDDDVKTQELVENTDPEAEAEYIERGAKVQWKQLLGVGVVVDF